MKAWLPIIALTVKMATTVYEREIGEHEEFLNMRLS